MTQPLVPTIPLAIVEWLEYLYPEPTLTLAWNAGAADPVPTSFTPEALALLHGQRSVARTVRLNYERQRQKRPGDLDGVPTVVA